METPSDSPAETDSLALLPEGRCPACEIGRLQPTVGPYEVELGDNLRITVENVSQEVCDHCGEIVLGAEAARIVDAAVADQTEQLTPRELERIREDLGVDQTEMSEILGLGAKTYHRWERGNQVTSRSMGYYLRVLAAFPEAFEWLRNRGWKRTNRLPAARKDIDFSVAFPNLIPLPDFADRRGTPAPNPARALLGKKAA